MKPSSLVSNGLRLLLGIASACALPVAPCRGQETPAVKTQRVARAEIRKLITELGHQRAERRKTAQKALMLDADADSPAVMDEALAVYTTTEDPEVMARVREVMFHVFESTVLKRQRGFLGIHMGPSTTMNTKGGVIQGIQVISVVENTAATEAGLLPGDVILAMDAFDMNQNRLVQAFSQYIQLKLPGDTIKLTIARGDNTRVADVRVGPLPETMKDSVPEAPAEERFSVWLKVRLQEEKRDHAGTTTHSAAP